MENTGSVDMNFSEALELIKAKKEVSRLHWKNAVSVFLVDGSQFKVSREPLPSILGEGTDVVYRPHIDMLASDGTIGVWSPSIEDVLAEDWYEVPAKVSTV